MAIRIARTAVGAPQNPPGDHSLSGSVYEFTPHGLTFAEPVTIRMPAGAVPAGATVSPFTAGVDDADWRRVEATVSDGLMAWQTFSFSWFVAGWCAPQTNHPQTCVNTTVTPQLTSTPSGAATLLNESVNHKAWSVTQSAAMRVAFDLTAPQDCIAPGQARLTVQRKASGSLPAETVLDQAVALAADPTSDLRSRQTVNWDFSLSQADNGFATYGVLFTCVRSTGTRRAIGGELVFKTHITAPQAPAFSSQPANATVTEPLAAEFTAVATGDPAPTLQWQRSNDDGNTWSDITGANAASYTTAATSASADSGARFRLVATNVAGSATSAAALLTVNAQAAGFWRPPESIENTLDNYEPSIGFTGDGRAYAVWNAGPSNTSRTWFSIRSAAGVWSAPAIIDGGLTSAFGVRIAVAPDGQAVAAWERGTTILANRYDGSAWSTPVTVSTGTADARNPTVAIHDSGRAVVVWYARDTSVNRYRAYGSANASGDAWSPPLALDGYEAGTPQVAVNGLGKGFVLFSERNASQQSALNVVPVDLASAGAVFGTSQELRPSGSGLGQMRVSTDSAGHAMAVWLDETATGQHLRWSRYSPNNSTWSAPADLALDVGTQVAIGRSYNLDLASSGSGDVVVAWGQSGITDGATSDQAVFTRRFSASTGTWAATERRSTNVPGVRDLAENPRVVIGASGRVAVTWLQYDGSVYQVWGQVFDGNWRTAERLTTSANDMFARNQHALAMSASGMPLAVWAELPPSGSVRPLQGAVWR